MDIYDEIKTERQRQIGKWGADESNEPFDHWYGVLSDYNGWARRMARMGSLDKYRRRMVQIAAIAVAVVEALDKATDGAFKPTKEV